MRLTRLLVCFCLAKQTQRDFNTINSGMSQGWFSFWSGFGELPSSTPGGAGRPRALAQPLCDGAALLSHMKAFLVILAVGEGEKNEERRGQPRSESRLSSSS